ncbi:MAG: ribonuclease [Pseudomonadota bacterium]
MRTFRSLLLIALLALTAGAQAKPPKSQPGQFDYYAVAMSWSPSYCATHRDPAQCGRGLGFVLHGLWPQHEAGYPESCSNEKLPGALQATYASLYPSPKLVGHEWRKHGTCSGLDPAAYFALSAKMKDQLVIPPAYQRPAAPVRSTPGELVQAFKAANPGTAVNGVLPFCDGGGRFLREVHACFDKGGRSRSCSAGEVKRSYNSCRQESFLLKNVK